MSCNDRAWRREAVFANRPLGERLFELVVSWQGPEPSPGQFFMLRAARSKVLLGRPISVFASELGRLSFVIAPRGSGTMELGELREGDGIMLEGPLGSSWESAAPEGRLAWRASGHSVGKPVALVGGGVGLAPLLFLASRLLPNTYDLFAGFRSGSWGLGAIEPRELRIFTEDGSIGARGRVLDRFDAAPYSAIHACGPEAMLRSVAALAERSGIPAWLSLERRMACGVGACLGCTVRTHHGNHRACVEGPIFRSEELIFDD